MQSVRESSLYSNTYFCSCVRLLTNTFQSDIKQTNLTQLNNCSLVSVYFRIPWKVLVRRLTQLPKYVIEYRELSLTDYIRERHPKYRISHSPGTVLVLSCGKLCSAVCMVTLSLSWILFLLLPEQLLFETTNLINYRSYINFVTIAKIGNQKILFCILRKIYINLYANI